MAKGRSRKSDKSDKQAAASSKSAAKLSSGLRKQLKRLQSQFEDAQRLERKRVRKLERARHRRQVAEAALADVLAEAPAAARPRKAKAAAKPKQS